MSKQRTYHLGVVVGWVLGTDAPPQVMESLEALRTHVYEQPGLDIIARGMGVIRPESPLPAADPKDPAPGRVMHISGSGDRITRIEAEGDAVIDAVRKIMADAHAESPPPVTADPPARSRHGLCRLSPEQVAEAARRYEAGEAAPALAAAYGVSKATMHRQLTAAGVAFRPRGGARDMASRKPQVTSPEAAMESPEPPEPAARGEKPEKQAQPSSKGSWSPEARADAAARLARMRAEQEARKQAKPESEYAGKRELEQPLHDDDWPDIEHRLAKASDQLAVRQYAEEYGVTYDAMQSFIEVMRFKAGMAKLSRK